MGTGILNTCSLGRGKHDGAFFVSFISAFSIGNLERMGKRSMSLVR